MIKLKDLLKESNNLLRVNAPNGTTDLFPNTNKGIICPEHGKQGLTEKDYVRQMWDADSLWKCPICRRPSQWDDDRYEDESLDSN